MSFTIAGFCKNFSFAGVCNRASLLLDFAIEFLFAVFCISIHVHMVKSLFVGGE